MDQANHPLIRRALRHEHCPKETNFKTTGEWHEAMKDIVLDGSLKFRGMPGFSHLLTEPEMELIRGYIIQQANEGRENAAEEQE